MQHRRFNLEKEKQVPLNWRRGMYRLWILASAAWAMGWVIFFAIEYTGGELSASQLLVAPIILFGPPLALLLFGIAARWAFQGFQSDENA
jgi:hypothetical protein